MTLPISPGLLAVIVILGVELLVIVMVIGYLVWGRGENNRSDIPDSGDLNGKSIPHGEGNDDVCIIENEVIEEKPEINSSSTSSEAEDKKSITSSSESSEESGSSSYEEDSSSSSSSSESENNEEVKEDLTDEEKNEEIQDVAPPLIEEEQLDNQVKTSSSSSRRESIASLHSSTSPAHSIRFSSSSSSSEEESKENRQSNEVDQLQDNDEDVFVPQTDENKEEEEETIQEPVNQPVHEVSGKPDANAHESAPSGSEAQVQSFDVGGITLSLRIEPGSAAPSLNVNGQIVGGARDDASTSSDSEDEASHLSNSDEIEVIRRYESARGENLITYDPVQKKVYEGGSASRNFPSFQSEDDYDVTSDLEGEEEAVAGIINVTSGEKLTICQAMNNGLIPKKTALLLLEAQAATGSVVNPRNGVKLSVGDAVTLGIIDAELKQTLVAAEGAYYGYMDPRTGENVSLSAAMSRGIFPKAQGTRLLEAQVATGGIIDPWTGLRYPLAGALNKGLIDRETAALLTSSADQTEFLDPATQRKLGYADLLSKCIRDLDTGLKFLYIEEKPKTFETRYQPELLIFRSAFRKKVTLQELIDADLVETQILNAFQAGRLSKEQLRDLLQPCLVGSDPIAGILNKTTRKVLTICQAVQDGLLRRSTALELLEAQVATGSIVDPISGKKMSVSRAVTSGLVDKQYLGKLRRAELAVLGYSEPGTKKTISLFEAMKRGVVIESHGIRMLEAQVATGGVIDPDAGYRIPTKLALKRGLFDQRMAQILTSTHHDMKGYYDPNTGDNLTYGELMQRCVKNKKKYGNMLLLPIRDKAPMAAALQKGPYRHRKVVIMDPSTKQQLTVDQALDAGVIDRDTADKLMKQESSQSGRRRT